MSELFTCFFFVEPSDSRNDLPQNGTSVSEMKEKIPPIVAFNLSEEEFDTLTALVNSCKLSARFVLLKGNYSKIASPDFNAISTRMTFLETSSSKLL